MKKIKNFTLFKESLVGRTTKEFDYIVYPCIDSGPNSELEEVYKFLISKGFVFPGNSSDNTIIYPADLYVKYVLVDFKLKEITYNTRYTGSFDKNDLYDFIVQDACIPDNENVYIVDNFFDLKRVIIGLNIYNYFDKKLVYESLLDKLEGPSEEEIHNKFLYDELSSYKYLNICQKNNITPLPKDIILNKIYGKTFENTIEYFDFLIQDIKNVTPTPKNIFTPFIKFGKDGKVIIVYDKHKNLIYFNNEIMNILILVFKSSCNELIKPLNKFIKDKLKIDTNVKIDFNYIPLSWEY